MVRPRPVSGGDEEMMEELVISVLVEMTLESYLCCVMGAEMYPDWPKKDYWPEEALKAQAIAARSYALWRLKHPRSDGLWTLYGDARDQGCDCNRRHPKSDKAVADTEGMIVTTDDPQFVARYVNRCGRPECPACAEKGGYDDRVWSDRMCQYGTAILARQGLTCEEILQYYYGSEAVVGRYDE